MLIGVDASRRLGAWLCCAEPRAACRPMPWAAAARQAVIRWDGWLLYCRAEGHFAPRLRGDRCVGITDCVVFSGNPHEAATMQRWYFLVAPLALSTGIQGLRRLRASARACIGDALHVCARVFCSRCRRLGGERQNTSDPPSPRRSAPPKGEGPSYLRAAMAAGGDEDDWGVCWDFERQNWASPQKSRPGIVCVCDAMTHAPRVGESRVLERKCACIGLPR